MSIDSRVPDMLCLALLLAVMGLACLSALTAVDATDVKGGIDHDTTWTKAGSPYVVTEAFYLSYATLTIEPGVQVLICESGVISGWMGKIVAEGTRDEPISFLPNVTGTKWQYISCGEGEVYRNCTFEGSQQGLILRSYSVVTDCTFSHSWVGVAVDEDAYGVTFRDCVVSDCEDGVATRGCSGLRLYNVTVSSCTQGFLFQGPGVECKDNVLEGCHVSGCTESGIRVYPHQELSVLNSTVVGGRFGIYHMNAVSASYVSTTVSGCSEAGLLLDLASPAAAAPLLVKGCSFADCPVGIEMQTYGPVHITECTFRRISDSALSMGNTHASPVLLWENDFLEDGEAIAEGAVSGSIVFYRNERGNFWLGYTGTDADGDGVGDTPKVVTSAYSDNYPLMRPHDKLAPVAEAGPDVIVDQHATFTLDGASSQDDTFIVNWTWTVDLVTSTTTFYGRSARGVVDAAGRFVTTLTVRDPAGRTAQDRLNLTVRDKDAPELVSHVPPARATTGDPLVLSFALADNVGVSEEWVIYRLVATGDVANLNLTHRGGMVWECAIPMQPTYLGAVHYSLYALDAAGNMLLRDFAEIQCVDDDPPVVTPKMRKNATTGDDYSVFCMVSENILLVDVWMEVDLGSGTPDARAMGREGAGWSALIPIPTNAPETVHLRFRATDSAGNWEWTAYYDLGVTDDEPPGIASVTGEPTALKGIKTLFGATVADNRGVERVLLNYSIERGANQSVLMDGSGGEYNAWVLVPRDAVGPLLYYVAAIDAEGNVAISEGYAAELVNDRPAVSAVPTWQVREGSEATLDLSGYVTDLNDGPDALAVKVSADGITSQGLTLRALFDDWKADQTIELEVTDGEDSIRFFLTVHVIDTNDPPVIDAIVSPANGTVVHLGDVLVFEVSVSDPEMATGQVMQITWSSDVSDWRWTMTSSMGFAFNTTNLPVGTHRLKVVVDDGAANATAWVEVTVKEREAERGGFLGDATGAAAGASAVLVLLLAARSRRRMARR